MAKKSIIDIDINDEKFKEFLSLFKEYQDSLDEMPKAWKELSDAMGHSGKAFNASAVKTMKTLEGSADSIAKMAESLHKATGEQDRFYRATTVSNSGMKRLSHSAKDLGFHLAGVGKTLFRIASVGAIGGAFGFLGLGERAYRRTREAKGLSMTPGQVSAFKTHMAPYVQPDAVLNSAANARNDITKWGYLAGGMGIPMRDVLHSNAEDLSFEMINRARDIWKKGPQTLQYAQAKGLTELGFSLEDLRRLSNTPRGELMHAESAARKDAGVLGFSGKTGREFTQLSVELKKAGVMIESVLIRGLAPLAPVFVGLAKGLSRDFVHFMNEPGTKKGIANMGKGLENVVGFLGSKDLRSDLSAFGEAVKDVTKAVLWASNSLKSVDINPMDWREAGSDLRNWWGSGDWRQTAKAFPPSAEEKNKLLKSSVPSHLRTSSGPGSTSVQTFLHKITAPPVRKSSAPSVNVRITAPPGMGLERSLNASAP